MVKKKRFARFAKGSLSFFSEKLRIFFCLVIFIFSNIFASHNTSRYFPFLEKPEEYSSYSSIHPSLFITTAATAFRRGGGNLGIPELWGNYDLKDVIAGLTALKDSQGVSGYNPFSTEIGYSDLNTKCIRFKMDGKIKSRGITLNANQKLYKNLSAGFFLPIMHVNSSVRFTFDRDKSDVSLFSYTTEEEEMLNRVRRKVHEDLDLKGGDWSKAGIGDLDTYIQWRHSWDHWLRLKSAHINARLGLLIPTGSKRDEDYPPSIPFMGNGHWGVYADLYSDFELRQNWRVGLTLGFIEEFANTEVRRIPYDVEPPIFSALVGDVKINPGFTFKFAPHLTIENLKDGMHFQLRYTYRRHASDTWTDKRCDKTVLSYLEASREHSACARSSRDSLSSWTSHYLTAQITYDSVEAMKKWWLKPKFYALLDYSLGGRGICKTHQFTFGVSLHPW